MSGLNKLETVVFWRESFFDDPTSPPVIGFIKLRLGEEDGEWVTILPSAPGQNAPSKSCLTREAYPTVNSLESCILWPTGGLGDKYIAYPVESFGPLPGILEPAMVEWQANEQSPREVISTFEPDGWGRYVRIFKGFDSTIRQHSPRPELTEPWGDDLPRPGDLTACWFNPLLVGPNQLVVNAYKAVEPREKNVVVGPGVIIVEPGGKKHNFSFQTKDDGKLIIIGEPISD